MKIYENFLDDYDFQKLNDLLTSKEIPWYVFREIANTNEIKGNLFCQTHTFFDDYKIMSPYFYLIEPLLKKLKVKSLIRARANFYPNNEKLSEHGWHKDTEFESNIGLLYINKNDGYTKFKNGRIIESIPNRLALFNSNEEHLSTNCTNTWARINVNLNFF